MINPDILDTREVVQLLKERVHAGNSRLYPSASIIPATFKLKELKCVPGLITAEDVDAASAAMDDAEYTRAVDSYASRSAIAAADKSRPIVLPVIVEQVHGDNVVVFGLNTLYAALERGLVDKNRVVCLLVRHVIGIPPAQQAVVAPLPESLSDYLLMEAMERENGTIRRLEPAY